jgi:hypothetical protein
VRQWVVSIVYAIAQAISTIQMGDLFWAKDNPPSRHYGTASGVPPSSLGPRSSPQPRQDRQSPSQPRGDAGPRTRTSPRTTGTSGRENLRGVRNHLPPPQDEAQAIKNVREYLCAAFGGAVTPTVYGCSGRGNARNAPRRGNSMGSCSSFRVNTRSCVAVPSRMLASPVAAWIGFRLAEALR